MPDYRKANDWKTRAGRGRYSVASPEARAFAAGREDRRCAHCLRVRPHYPRRDGRPSARCAVCNERKRTHGRFPKKRTQPPLEEHTWVSVTCHMREIQLVTIDRRIDQPALPPDGVVCLGYLVRRAKNRPHRWLVAIWDGPEMWIHPRDIKFAAYPEANKPSADAKPE